MKVKFETVVTGINNYISKNIYGNLSHTQEFLARIVVGRLNQSAASLKNTMMNNGFLKTLCIIDDNGMVDVEQILNEVRREIERQGSVCFEIPLIGKLTFNAADVDALYDVLVRSV